jgi:hypothetical protein
VFGGKRPTGLANAIRAAERSDDLTAARRDQSPGEM